MQKRPAKGQNAREYKKVKGKIRHQLNEEMQERTNKDQKFSRPAKGQNARKNRQRENTKETSQRTKCNRV
jgi:hypothetical protein